MPEPEAQLGGSFCKSDGCKGSFTYDVHQKMGFLDPPSSVLTVLLEIINPKYPSPRKPRSPKQNFSTLRF